MGEQIVSEVIKTNLKEVKPVLFAVSTYFEDKGFRTCFEKTSDGGFVSIQKAGVLRALMLGAKMSAMNATLKIQDDSIYVEVEKGAFKAESAENVSEKSGAVTSGLLFGLIGALFGLIVYGFYLLRWSKLDEKMMEVIKFSIHKQEQK